LWKATNKLNRPRTHVPPIRAADGSWAKSDGEKAQTFADYLQMVFVPHPSAAGISDFLDAPCQMSLLIPSFSPKEVSVAIACTKVCKAPGYDLITGKVLHELPRKA
jgi:hypothetical protein